jgi:hypothetical protein
VDLGDDPSHADPADRQGPNDRSDGSETDEKNRPRDAARRALRYLDPVEQLTGESHANQDDESSHFHVVLPEIESSLR